MLGFEDQWPTATTPDCSPMNDGLEYQSIASTPLSSPVDYGSEFRPSSSEEDESDFEPPEPHGNNNHIQIHQTSVTLNHHHLRSDTDLKVGSIFSKGETLGVHDGSFLMITELGKSKKGRPVDFVGHLFRPIEEFKDYLPVESSGSGLVWLCEAKEHDSEPRCYLRHARGKDVLRVRQLVLVNSGCAPAFPQSRATGILTDPRPLACQWKSAAGLSSSHVTGGARRFRSIRNGSQGQPKAFTELSSQELFLGGTLSAHFSHSRHHLDSDPPEAWSDDGSSRVKSHGCPTGRNTGTCKERRRDTSRSLLLAPSANGERVVKATGKPAVRKSSAHFQLYLARMLAFSSAQKTASEQGIVTQVFTFADAFCGAGGMSVCTVREAACLNGFPADHAFCGRLSATKKQVANAVPPPVSKAILEEVKRSLMGMDALRRS